MAPPERADCERHHGRPGQQERKQRNAAEDPGQYLGAANPISQPATERSHERRQDDEASRAEACVSRCKAELRPQQRRQVDREGDEAAKRQKVKRPKQPGRRRVPQDRGHGGNRGGTSGLRRVAGEGDVDDGPDQQERARAAKDGLPPPPRGHNRTNEDR